VEIPSLLFEKKISYPKIKIDLLNLGNQTFIRAPCIRYPSNDLQKISEDEWIIMDDRKLNFYNGSKLISSKDLDFDVLDAFYENEEIYFVKRYSKKLKVGNTTYEKIERSFDTLVLIGNKELLINVNGKTYTLDEPINYLLNKRIISIQYNSQNLVLNLFTGSKRSFNDELFHLDESQNVAVDYKGRIYIDDELVGICKSSSVEYLGKLNGKLLILCGNEVKYFAENSWYNLGTVQDSFSAKASGELLALLRNEMLEIYDINLSKIFEFKGVLASTVSYKNVFLINKNGYYGILDLFSKEEIKVLNDKINSSSSFSISLASLPLLDVIPVNGKIRKIDRDRKIVEIDPTNYDLDGNIELNIISHFFSIKRSFRVDIEPPKFSLKDTHILLSPSGYHLKGYPNCNAYMKGELKCNVPFETKAKIYVGKNSFEFDLKKGTQSLDLFLPLLIDKVEPETIKLCVSSFPCKEFVVNGEIADVSQKRSSIVKIVRNSTVYKEMVSEIDKFEKIELISKNTEKYDSIVYARIGNNITIDNKIINVNKSIEKVLVKNGNNYIREYLIVGISDPLKDIHVNISGNLMYVNVMVIRESAVEIIYCDEERRELLRSQKEFEFPIIPECSKLIINVVDKGLHWDHVYTIVRGTESYFQLAIYNSMKLQQELESFGLV
jgi:hypothetical protein